MEVSVFGFVFVCLLVLGFFNRGTSEEYVYTMCALDCCGLKSEQLSRMKYRNQV